MIRIWRNFCTSVRIRPSDSAYGSLFAPSRAAKVSPEVFGAVAGCERPDGGCFAPSRVAKVSPGIFGAFAGRERLAGGFFAPSRAAKVSPEVFGAVASRDGLPEKFKEDRGGKR